MDNDTIRNDILEKINRDGDEQLSLKTLDHNDCSI